MSPWSFQDSKWRQGAVIPPVLVPNGVLPPGLAEGAKLIIITHDCDIVQPSLEAEPYVEFLIAKPMREDQKNGVLFRGRNVRRLQFVLKEGGASKLYEISAHDRFRIDRKELENQEPDTSTTLNLQTIGTIASWYAKRYKRSSFPTAFNSRIPDRTWKKIKKVLQKDGDDVLIFMGLNSMEELSLDQPTRYSFGLWCQARPLKMICASRRHFWWLQLSKSNSPNVRELKSLNVVWSQKLSLVLRIICTTPLNGTPSIT